MQLRNLKYSEHSRTLVNQFRDFLFPQIEVYEGLIPAYAGVFDSRRDYESFGEETFLDRISFMSKRKKGGMTTVTPPSLPAEEDKEKKKKHFGRKSQIIILVDDKGNKHFKGKRNGSR